MLRAGSDENVCVCGGGGGGVLMFIRLFKCFRRGPGEAEFVQLYHMQQSNPFHVFLHEHLWEPQSDLRLHVPISNKEA